MRRRSPGDPCASAEGGRIPRGEGLTAASEMDVEAEREGRLTREVEEVEYWWEEVMMPGFLSDLTPDCGKISCSGNGSLIRPGQRASCQPPPANPPIQQLAGNFLLPPSH